MTDVSSTPITDISSTPITDISSTPITDISSTPITDISSTPITDITPPPFVLPVVGVDPPPAISLTPSSYMGISTGNIRIFAVLYIATENEVLRDKYIQASILHNRKIVLDSYPDSGFDLYVPDDVIFDTHFETKFIDMQIKTKMIYYMGTVFPAITSGFYMYPRSSMSNTELMLANHTGVIDSGYRGNLIGAFRWLPIGTNTSYTVLKDTRMVQVCHPSLCPVFGLVVPDITIDTLRGENGFGSTGV